MTVMVFLFVLGLVAISVLLGVMKSVLNFEFGPLIAFAFLSIFILLGLEGILISRLFRRKHRPEKSSDSARPTTHVTRELEAQSRVMGEPVSSVTEHTTRILDPIPRANS
jgi:predicted lipid-binding transport protein (Tim44 family)